MLFMFYTIFVNCVAIKHKNDLDQRTFSCTLLKENIRSINNFIYELYTTPEQ